MMDVYVLDTETTGFDPENNSIVEIAAIEYWSGEWEQTLVKPDHPISFDAMATHLITEEMVSYQLSLHEAIRYFEIRTADVLVAHNADFDKSFLPGYREEDGVKWICTWRCAQHLMPKSQSFKNIALCLENDLNIWSAPQINGNSSASMPHRALFDAWATRLLLQHLVHLAHVKIEGDSPATMSDDEIMSYLVDLTAQPFLLKSLSFGKHKDVPIEDVPSGYLRWVFTKDFGPDVDYTIKCELEKRGRL